MDDGAPLLLYRYLYCLALRRVPGPSCPKAVPSCLLRPRQGCCRPCAAHMRRPVGGLRSRGGNITEYSQNDRAVSSHWLELLHKGCCTVFGRSVLHVKLPHPAPSCMHPPPLLHLRWRLAVGRCALSPYPLPLPAMVVNGWLVCLKSYSNTLCPAVPRATM